MYVVTFYSFKGGVGRSMAMMNIAYELANIGRKVLVVDFDLEAPGLDTYTDCSSEGRLGLVDYVTSYLKDGIAPSIADYVFECAPYEKSNTKIWIMPAGVRDGKYGARLSEIDWKKVYSENDGYLLMEHMRQEWERHIAPDYVLIDSRTGYTDESGICTRQLPDAVVYLFLLNDQNLQGIKHVVTSARRDSTRRKAEHFVASQVPNLDDEDDIIVNKIRAFKKELKTSDLSVIHEYDSLDLIQQKVFTACRPKTRLSNEYRALVDTIIQKNHEDRKGALSYLRHVAKMSKGLPTNFAVSMDAISFHFRDDPEVMVAAARAWAKHQNFDASMELLDRALELGSATADTYGYRAFILMSRGEIDNAIDDLVKAMACPDIGYAEAMFFLGLIRNKQDYADVVMNSIGNLRANLSSAELQLLCVELMSHEAFIGAAEQLCLALMEDKDFEGIANNQYVLCCIRQKKFESAIKVIEQRSAPWQIAEQFNYAMAKWALHGYVSPELFRRVVALADEGSDQERDANAFQCFAIAYWATGDKNRALASLERALKESERIGRSVFSAWSYLYVDKSRFRKDVQELQKLVEGSESLPNFMQGATTTVH